MSEALARINNKISRLEQRLALRHRADREWHEEDHPRGQPGNPGQFGPGGSSGKRSPEAPQRRERMIRLSEPAKRRFLARGEYKAGSPTRRQIAEKIEAKLPHALAVEWHEERMTFVHAVNAVRSWSKREKASEEDVEGILKLSSRVAVAGIAIALGGESAGFAQAAVIMVHHLVEHAILEHSTKAVGRAALRKITRAREREEEIEEEGGRLDADQPPAQDMDLLMQFFAWLVDVIRNAPLSEAEADKLLGADQDAA